VGPGVWDEVTCLGGGDAKWDVGVNIVGPIGKVYLQMRPGTSTGSLRTPPTWPQPSTPPVTSRGKVERKNFNSTSPLFIIDFIAVLAVFVVIKIRAVE
jgi:hypothetical protein